MLKKTAFFLFLLIAIWIFPANFFAEDIKNPSGITIGEELFYDVKFLGIKGVDVTFEVIGLENIKGDRGAIESPVYHIRITAKTNDFFTKFVYKVDNLYEVFLDTTTLEPRLFRKKIRQGKEDNYDREVYTLVEKNAAYYDDGFAIKILKNTYELFSAIYLLRKEADNLTLGDTLKLNTLSDKILWDLHIIPQKKETMHISISAIISLGISFFSYFLIDRLVSMQSKVSIIKIGVVRY